MSVPSEIASYFTPNETVLKYWSSKDWNIYATQFRVFLYKAGVLSKQVIEASYEHISSIELSRKRPLKRLAGAIFMFIVGFFINNIYTSMYYYYRGPSYSQYTIIFWIVGIGLLIWFIIGVQSIKFHIVGRSPITLPKELTEMVRFIREKRPQEVYVREPLTQAPPQIRQTILEVVMIPCQYCGALMPQTSTFCPNCGAKRKTQSL